MSWSPFRVVGVLAAGWMVGGCGRSLEDCFDDGVLDCVDAQLAEPDGSDACRQQYLVGYAEACICSTVGPPYLTTPTTTIPE